MREYKRKRLAEEWSSDIRPTKIRKQLNSSERWRGKRDIEKQLEELKHEPHLDREDEWNRGIDQYYNSTPCVKCMTDHHYLDKLGLTFHRLGFIVLTDHGRDHYSCKHRQDN